MENDSPSVVVQKSLFSWIFSKNTWLQIVLVVAAIFAVFANVFPLEMQKRIVNDAIILGKFDMLVLYCGLYLIAVITASLLKYLINILQMTFTMGWYVTQKDDCKPINIISKRK